MQVHRCRFVDWVPDAVDSLAFNPDGSVLALGRANGTIELFNFISSTNSWFRSLDIAGESDFSARTLAWAKNSSPSSRPGRLFSSGLSGSICEWSVSALGRIRDSPSLGGSVWCISVNPEGNTLAVACEDGCVRLFTLIDETTGTDCLDFKFAFPKRKERVICVCWSPDGQLLFCGDSTGSISGWDISTKRSTFSASLDLIPETKSIIWSIICLYDNTTLVTGDSQGKTIFWDIPTSTLRQSFKEHQADVLTIVSSKTTPDIVFSAGIDGKLCMFQLPSKTTRWISRGGIRRHTHDIKALAMFNQTIVSGGVDTQAVVFTIESYFQGKTQCLLSPFPLTSGSSFISYSSEPKLLLSRSKKLIQLWKLGYSSENPNQQQLGICLPFKEKQTHLLNFELANSKTALTASTISKFGNFLACSDRFNLRLFSITFNDESQTKIKLRKVILPDNIPSAYRLIFTEDERYLIISTFFGSLIILELNSTSNRADFAAQFKDSGRGIEGDSDIIHIITTSSDSKWIAAISASNIIRIFNVSEKNEIKEHGFVPSIGIPFTAAAFSSASNLLVLTTTDCRYHILDIETTTFTPFSLSINSNEIPYLSIPKGDFAVGIAVNKTEQSSVYLYGRTWICRAPIEEDTTNSSKIPTPNNRYHLILSTDFVGNDELVVVERPWMYILQKLPAAFSSPNRFAT